jgi:hypothetical protein
LQPVGIAVDGRQFGCEVGVHDDVLGEGRWFDDLDRAGDDVAEIEELRVEP